MKKTINKLWEKFLIFFSELKLVKWFPWIQYDPVNWKIDGKKYSQILKSIQPGDIILRRFDNYVDNWFIDGFYSHAGLYIGKNKIIHAANPKVQQIDIFDFCKCDNICIMRPSGFQKKAISKAKIFMKNQIKYDFNYETDNESLYCFEMCAKCYDKLDVKILQQKLFFGLIKRNEVYLGDSFIKSNDFKMILKI